MTEKELRKGQNSVDIVSATTITTVVKQEVDDGVLPKKEEANEDDGKEKDKDDIRRRGREGEGEERRRRNRRVSYLFQSSAINSHAFRVV